MIIIIDPSFLLEVFGFHNRHFESCNVTLCGF